MIILDFVRGVLQRQFVPESPADDYGPRLEAAFRAIGEALPSTLRMAEAFGNGDTAALAELAPATARSFEAVNSARLRLEQVKPEYRLRKLHKLAVLVIRAYLARQDVLGEVMLASTTGDHKRASDRLGKARLYGQVMVDGCGKFELELGRLRTERPSLYRLLGISESTWDEIANDMENAIPGGAQ